MNFKYYDILSNLVPGYLILVTIDLLFKEEIPDISVIPQIGIAFIIGYFNNTFSSWLEGFYRFLWGGNPINKFFNKNGIWKVPFFKGKEVKAILQEGVKNNADSSFSLFVEAMRIANNKPTERLNDFNASYSFSRGVLTAILICGVLSVTQFYDNLLYYVIFICIFIVSLIRCKQRNGYYIKEVLNIVLKENQITI